MHCTYELCFIECKSLFAMPAINIAQYAHFKSSKPIQTNAK